MELRYEQVGKYYNPQKKLEDKWVSFNEKDFKEYRHLREVILGLARVDTDESWPNSYYSNTNELFFRSEMTCMAFLGAAKVQFTPQVKEFKI